MRLLLFSGGLDSTALAWSQRPDLCLTIDYGQRPAQGEIRAASGLSGLMGLRHEVLTVDLAHLGSGSLAGSETATVGSAPEWWPYRNQMLITLAAMKFVGQGLKEIMFGAVATDVHADGKKPFVNAISSLVSLQEGAVRVTAPAIDSDPVDLIRDSGLPASLLGATFSCHVAEYPCGHCRGCEKHSDTMRELAGAARP
ncbi:7-cyano-7-deazaguanine synthase [Rhizobium laguerreae]|uniref:7-cyano-7-deazaguanine synthase n=1 Tax=Rhizobium laguerreae TaxID=1076926 RepID=UPI001441049E|nr:7-cyano-7-deazaguanine synthase [Rhizobium laguerreae]NKM35952.1 7-cyano-7-deazaguanine synthase [Rhizobium laguerreae]